MPLETRPLGESFACEVLGLRLWEPFDDRTIAELRALWAEHPVLVFRRQALSEDELANFSARFGPLERTDWASPVRPEVTLISNLKDGQARPIGGLGDGELQWHSDQSYMLQPATGAMLYALELPAEGGTTSWVDLAPGLAHRVEAWNAGLSPDFKRFTAAIAHMAPLPEPPAALGLPRRVVLGEALEIGITPNKAVRHKAGSAPLWQASSDRRGIAAI